MRPEWLWDRNISVDKIQKILKDPHHERFVAIAALLLSRNNVPKEIFAQYLDRKVFVQQWSRIKRQMRKDAWNDPRIIFWQAVYEKLFAEFKHKGIPIRVMKEEKAVNDIARNIAEQLKTLRRDGNLTQKELADRIGISQQIISRIEKGRDDMRLFTLVKVFSFLGEQIVVEPRSAWMPDKISDGKKEVAHA